MTPEKNNPSAHSDDPTAVSRKHDHIALAFDSRVDAGDLDDRFFYEPLFSAHPEPGSLPPIPFLGKILKAPIWVSSMTGGTALAGKINHQLARACGEFGMGMGLGSCRQLLYSDEFLPDFDVRDTMGPDALLFANLGIAQVETLLAKGESERIIRLLERLRADGLILHINPLQEAMQPEGDRFERPPLETIQALLEKINHPLIVKEVGQGFGPKSLKALLELPLGAIEFAAAGGTIFAKLELLRSDAMHQAALLQISNLGHHASEMLDWCNQLAQNDTRQTRHLIISGGIRHFLDGYYLTRKSALPAVYGQASAFLKHAQGSYEDLQAFVRTQIRGLELAHAFLTVK